MFPFLFCHSYCNQLLIAVVSVIGCALVVFQQFGSKRSTAYEFEMALSFLTLVPELVASDYVSLPTNQFMLRSPYHRIDQNVTLKYHLPVRYDLVLLAGPCYWYLSYIVCRRSCSLELALTYRLTMGIGIGCRGFPLCWAVIAWYVMTQRPLSKLPRAIWPRLSKQMAMRLTRSSRRSVCRYRASGLGNIDCRCRANVAQREVGTSTLFWHDCHIERCWESKRPHLFVPCIFLNIVQCDFVVVSDF